MRHAHELGRPFRTPVANAAVAGADPDRRALLRGLLHLQHHHVVAEGEGEELLGALGGAAPVELLVVDAELGAARWRKIAGAARKQHPDLRVVLVTRSATERLARSATAAGVSVVLRQPFLVQEFAEALDRPLARSGAYVGSAPRPKRKRRDG